MRAGELDTPLVIEQRSVTRDAYGAELVSWITFASSWGRFEDVGGGESLRGAEVQAQRLTRVTVRHVAGITADMRVVGAGRTLQIKAIAEISRARGWRLLCEDFNEA